MGVWKILGMVLAALFGVLVGSLQAAEREPFFQPESARDVLPASVLLSDQAGIEYFLPQRADPTPTPVAEDHFSIDLKLTSQQKIENPDTAQKILAEFGDPASEAPVTPVENAPKPFKAMLTALNAGEKDLAWQYARQYARYLRDLKDKNLYMTGLVGKASEVEGVLPTGSWASSPIFNEIGVLAEKNLADEKALKGGEDEMRELEVATLTPDQLAMLERAKEEVNWGARIEGKVEIKPLDPAAEKRERQKLRQQFSRSVPRAREGKIDIYLFARLGDSNATPTLFALEELYKKYRENQNLQFHGFALGMASEDQIKKLPGLGINYSFENGNDLAQRLKIKRSPTLVFVARGSGESVVEEGDRPFHFMEELLRAMGGADK